MPTIDIYYHPYLLGAFLVVVVFVLVKTLIELIP
jgi:hypothetical protein